MAEIVLREPEAGDVADQCREMGIAVGDTIEGREYNGRHWHDARLTLLWLGESEAAWLVSERDDLAPEWDEPGESVDWELSGRPWRKVS